MGKITATWVFAFTCACSAPSDPHPSSAGGGATSQDPSPPAQASPGAPNATTVPLHPIELPAKGTLPAIPTSGPPPGPIQVGATDARAIPAYCGDFQYPGGNGNSMTVCHPAGLSNVPLLFLVHGGAWIGGDRTNMNPFMVQGFLSGAAVATVDYTLGASMGQIYGEVLAALRDLQFFSGPLGFDGNKIGCLGVSAGGHLVMLLATANGTSLCKATGSMSGPTNLVDLFLRTTPDVRVALNQVMGRTPASLNDPEYELGSPLFQIHGDGNHPGHIFQMFATTDVLVPPSEGQAFQGAMAPIAKTYGLQNRLDVVPGVPDGGHGYTAAEVGAGIDAQVAWALSVLR